MAIVTTINRGHPLLQGMMSWWLVTPSRMGGSMIPDLLNHAPAMFAGGKPTWDSAIGRPGGKGSVRCIAPQWLKATAPEVSYVSIACWVRLANDTVEQELVSNTGDTVLLRVTDNGVPGATFYVQVAGAYYGTALTPGLGSTWRHLCGTFDGTTISLYLDGTLASFASGSIGPITFLGTNNVLVGIHSALTQFPFTGVIDDIGRWNRALSAAEVRQWYQLSLKRFPGILQTRMRVSGTMYIPPYLMDPHIGSSRPFPFKPGSARSR